MIYFNGGICRQNGGINGEMVRSYPTFCREIMKNAYNP